MSSTVIVPATLTSKIRCGLFVSTMKPEIPPPIRSRPA